MAFSQSNSESSTKRQSSLHLQNAWQAFNECRNKGIFCDVVIKVQGVRFPVHRLVLCTCSDYFRSLFMGKWKNSEKPEIEIPGVSASVMDLLLNFAYTGKVTVTLSNVEELLPAADQFLVTYVKDKCCAFLKKQLTISNCIEIRRYARSYFCPNLIDAATNYILRYFDDVSRLSEEFLLLTFEDLEQLISDDRLNVHAEENVCETIFRWVLHNRSARINFFTPLLRCVRFGLLEPEYFMTKVKGSDFANLIGSDLAMECLADCRSLIQEAMKVICDLHVPERESSTTQEQLFNNFLRPRLPFEVLLAVGGWSGGSPTNAIEAYDHRAEIWVNISTLPDSESNEQFKTVADIPRAYHGIAYVKGCIYVIGGFDGFNYFNTVRKMDATTFEWVQEPSMLHKRCYISVTVERDIIYALGGMNGERRLNSGECYDPSSKTWTDLPDMHDRRSDASATSLNGKVYIAGGFNGQECLFTAEFYDPEEMVWTRITPMRSRRSGVSIISFHGLIYAVGGFDGINRLRHAEAYSPLTNSWKNTRNMITPRSNFGIEVIDEKLIVVGGYNGQRTTADVEAYDDATNEWNVLKDMHICRSALSCCVVEGLPHAILKKYCMPRDMPSAFSDELQLNEDATLSAGSENSTSNEDETANYNALDGSNLFLLAENDIGSRDVTNDNR